METRFAREKEQILSQYILHHEVSDSEVVDLSERLDKVVEMGAYLHREHKRKSGEPYIIHPIRTAMELSRFGRIVDVVALEAAILHDTVEDKCCTYEELRADFPEAAELVLALTKIKDSPELTYQRLYGGALEDIRILLIKIADRLDNLESLEVFGRDKQIRIASESEDMYTNTCRRLCMMELAERLSEKAGSYLFKEEMERFLKEQELAKEELAKPLGQIKTLLTEKLPKEIGARTEIKWNRFSPKLAGFKNWNGFYQLRVITNTNEDAYRALGVIHTTFKALPKSFEDTISNPMLNDFKALETVVSYKGIFVPVYIAGRAEDKYNRIGLLSMDVDSPDFNHKYLEDLKEFLQSDPEDSKIPDFIRFQKPDAIQVSSPNGDVYQLEEGATALDFAFAVHKELGLRATGAEINGHRRELDYILHTGNVVKIEAAPAPVCDERYLGWAHSRRAITALKKQLKKVEDERAAATGRQWLLEAAEAEGLDTETAEAIVAKFAEETERTVNAVYTGVCLSDIEISEIFPPTQTPKTLSETIVRFLLPGKSGQERKVSRYDFKDPHIRFCQHCIPLQGDEIEGTRENQRLHIHRKGCEHAKNRTKIPLAWDKSKKAEQLDPGSVVMEVTTDGSPEAFYAAIMPLKSQEIELHDIRMPGKDNILKVFFTPGAAATLNKLIGSLRGDKHIKSIRLMRYILPKS